MAQNKLCEKCNAAFECRADDITHCACSQIILPQREKDLIKSKYKDCLCAKCLQEIALISHSKS